MKFNVGDKVRFVKSIIYHNKAGELGEIYTVQEVYNRIYRIENGEWFNEEELVLANYTYEDLKKSPIGTKVTFENGKVLVKDDEDRYENSKTYRHNEDLDGIKDNSDYGRIIRIEEPEYTTVYESKVEILDEVEKRYLRGVIRPFRNKVKSIRKTDNNMNGKDNEYLTITLTEEPNMDFPNFEPNSMYQRMKLYKEYTLEELGL